MGEYFLIVNPVKRQYLSAEPFGENIKHAGIFVGRHGHAVGLLLCDRADEHHPLLGSWVGDPVIVAGDYSAPGTAGISTLLPDEQDRNLYHLAKDEFEDISHQVMVMLFTMPDGYDENALDQFLYQAMWDWSLFDALQQITASSEYTTLQDALERIAGLKWPELYLKILEIRDLCLSFMGPRWLMAQKREEIPTFRVGKRIFAKLRRVKGRWSLWCKAKPETLDRLVRAHPQRFFVPSSSTSSQGWIGTWIDEIIDWKEVAFLLKESYRMTAPERVGAGG